MKPKRRKRTDKGAPKWMVTYADMVTLILVFFILLFSMSQIDLVKFQVIAESFKNRMIFDNAPSPIPMENPTENSKVQKESEGSTDLKNSGSESENQDQNQQPVNQTNTNMEERPENSSLDELLKEVQDFLDKNELNNVITANRTEQGVVLILQEKVLFDSGEADIINSGKPFLKKMGMLLSNIPNDVRVEGHTDNRPISNYRFPSNWELSGARASSVIRYVISTNEIDKKRFVAVGYGDTEPLVKNDSPANWSKNRRVEVVILELNNSNS